MTVNKGASAKNIVLCGFMGSGKTTLGGLLAQRLGIGFVDIDDYIVEQAGLSVPAIFRTFGEQGFRDREHQAILALCGQEQQVLATGGGALTFQRNVEPLRRQGVIIYLNPGFEACWERICRSDRPLVHSNTKEQLEEMYRNRDQQYREACQAELRVVGPLSQWVNALEQLAINAIKES